MYDMARLEYTKASSFLLPSVEGSYSLSIFVMHWVQQSIALSYSQTLKCTFPLSFSDVGSFTTTLRLPLTTIFDWGLALTLFLESSQGLQGLQSRFYSSYNRFSSSSGLNLSQALQQSCTVLTSLIISFLFSSFYFLSFSAASFSSSIFFLLSSSSSCLMTSLSASFCLDLSFYFISISAYQSKRSVTYYLSYWALLRMVCCSSNDML